jgi:hypothetical protein
MVETTYNLTRREFNSLWQKYKRNGEKLLSASARVYYFEKNLSKSLKLKYFEENSLYFEENSAAAGFFGTLSGNEKDINWFLLQL